MNFPRKSQIVPAPSHVEQRSSHLAFGDCNHALDAGLRLRFAVLRFVLLPDGIWTAETACDDSRGNFGAVMTGRQRSHRHDNGCAPRPSRISISLRSPRGPVLGALRR